MYSITDYMLLDKKVIKRKVKTKRMKILLKWPFDNLKGHTNGRSKANKNI